MDLQMHFPVFHKKHIDERGMFVEIIRSHGGGQVSFSTTKPGVTRGNHYHTRKIERFTVLQGKALIRLRRTGTSEILNFTLSGEDPAYVDIPMWFTHNIMNVGKGDLIAQFWTNELFDPNDPDTYFEIV
jgi:UDP-2-acetamido-2,6-beta-L-arabino-hexul-4-ose reductase